MPEAKYILGKHRAVIDIYDTHTLKIAPPGTEANLTGVQIGLLGFAADQSAVSFVVQFPWPYAEHVFQPLAGEQARQENAFLPSRTIVVRIAANGDDVLAALAEDSRSGARVGLLVEDEAVSNY